MTPLHYYNYCNKYGRDAANKRQRLDEQSERNRTEQAIVDSKTWGMGCNE